MKLMVFTMPRRNMAKQKLIKLTSQGTKFTDKTRLLETEVEVY